MDVFSIILFLAAGLAARMIAGLYGTGLAVLLAPLAVVAMRVSGVSSLVATHLAFGSTLGAAAISALWNVGKTARSGEIDWAAVKPGAVGALIAAVAGAMFAGGFQAPGLQRAAGVVLGVAALRLFTASTKGKKESTPSHNPVGMFGVGAVTGFTSGLTGGSGDTVGSFLASAGYGFSQRKAAATTFAMNLAALVSGAVMFALIGAKNPLVPAGNAGYVSLWGVAAMAVGTLLGGFATHALAPKLSVERSANVVGVVLLVGAIRLVLFS
jgi:uncharacterized membrane protein YfcA